MRGEFQFFVVCLLVVLNFASLAAQAEQAPPAAGQAQTAEQEEKEEQLKRLYEQVVQTTDLQRKLDLLNQMVAIDFNNTFALQERERVRQQLEALTAEQQEQMRLESQRADARKAAQEAYEAEDWQAAKEAYEKVLELDEEDEQARRRLTYVEAQLKSEAQLWWFKLILGILLLVGLLVGGYFWWTRRRPKLQVLAGPEVGRVFKLDKDEVSLGALESEVDFVFSDSERRISRQHCVISRAAKGYVITDFSTNGTLLNGEPIPYGEPVPLRRGDQISLADAVYIRFK